MLAESEDHDDKFLYRFIYANGQRIVLYDKNNRRNFYLNDHLGSPRVLVDSAGTKRDVYKYYAFGSRAGGTAGTNQAYRYTGKPFDEELDLDLYYYGARYYYPEIGRFPTVDPLHGMSPGTSPYVYSFNNPLRYTDPTGMAGEAGESEEEEEEKKEALVNGPVGGGAATAAQAVQESNERTQPLVEAAKERLYNKADQVSKAADKASTDLTALGVALIIVPGLYAQATGGALLTAGTVTDFSRMDRLTLRHRPILRRRSRVSAGIHW